MSSLREFLYKKGIGFLFLFLLCFVLFCFVFCFVLFCFVLFCFVLFCFVLFCFVLFCFFDICSFKIWTWKPSMGFSRKWQVVHRPNRVSGCCLVQLNFLMYFLVSFHNIRLPCESVSSDLFSEGGSYTAQTRLVRLGPTQIFIYLLEICYNIEISPVSILHNRCAVLCKMQV